MGFVSVFSRVLLLLAALVLALPGVVQAAKAKSQQVWEDEEDRRVQLSVETALYKQPALLAQQLNALKASDPKRVNMYFIGVAGDGEQEVFRREIEYVKREFDEQHGTQGRSVVLANSRSSVERLPMATVTSIRESLKAVAAKMDKSRDVLFLYLTSHGSPDHVLALEQEGMFLRGLGAKELADLLKESGIRWKVVVVGACYSGGFIAPLKEDHTIVITASRPDRSSFGCQDENDFTYFGRAFFKDALPASSSLSDAFDMARKLVRQRETQLFGRSRKQARAYSEPQMYDPPEAKRYLAQWWLGSKEPAEQQAP